MPFDVPAFIKDNAQRGLDYNRDGKGGDGLTDQTLEEARDLAKGFTTESKLRKMVGWFARHQPDLDAPKNKPGNPDFPGAGAVAWLIWGGSVYGDTMDAAKWAEKQVSKLDAQQASFDSDCIVKPMAKDILTTEDKLAASMQELAAAKSELTELQTGFEKLAAEKVASLSAADSQLAAVNTQLAEANTKLQAAVAEAAELKAQLETALANQISATKEAAKIVRSVGIEAAAISPADEAKAAADEKKSADEIKKQFLAMKPSPERAAFFQANKLAILS